MPKATSKSCTARKYEPSAKQHDNVGKTATGSGSSQWRASKIGSAVTITKTNALGQYHLKAADLEDIPFRTKDTVVNGGHVRTMYLYKERDVERRAWEKQGGPEAFDKHLAELRARHLQKKGDSAYFPQPRSYEDPHGGVYIAGRTPGSSSRPVDPYVGKSPTLLNVKRQIPLWLWTACNKALSAVDEADELAMALGDGSFTKDKDREDPMKAALGFAATYPPRPDERLPSSDSVDRVRAVLAEAASAPEFGPDWGRDDIPGLTLCPSYCGPKLMEEYPWSSDFLERLFTSLIQLIDELGVGSEGWESIRWEVYDKYVEYMHEGPQYDRRTGRWTYWAAEWLDGKFSDVGIQLVVSCRGQCPAGRRFNDMLPLRHPQGHRLVGR